MIRYIYTFFVSLFLAVFIGTGIAVFYQAPKAPEPPSFYDSGMQKELTDVEKKIEEEFSVNQRAWEAEMKEYNRNVSMIVLACAVVILTITLSLSDKLGVVADGLLLGGIFTLLYGIIRGMDTDNPKYRFLVSTIGLIVAIVLGYIKFTRGKHSEMNGAKKTGANA